MGKRAFLHPEMMHGTRLRSLNPRRAQLSGGGLLLIIDFGQSDAGAYAMAKRGRERWTCQGCGSEQQKRTIDTHRWVTTNVDPSGRHLGEARELELCPSCRCRLMAQQCPKSFDAAR